LLSECYNQLPPVLAREPDFLCDNAPEKWGKVFWGKKCLSPSELGELADRTAVIITVRKYEEIYQQLRHIGIKDIFLSLFDSGYYFVQEIQRLEDLQPEAARKESLIPHLDGKWALVTGASRGVGRQIATAMAQLGSNIIAHSRCVSHVQDLIETCSAYGVKLIPVEAELSNLDEVEAMLSHLENLDLQVDILFNNAAISPPSPSGFWSISGEIYRDCFTVNTIAPARMCQRLIPPMVDRGYGRVINLNTNIQKRPGEMAYACSKAALDKFVHDLAPSLQDTGVMLTLVDPGWVRTDAGGPDALYEVESVIPGVLLGALLDDDINGCRFSAQDYSGLSTEEAILRAKQHLRRDDSIRWI